jgi:hypothetical protein
MSTGSGKSLLVLTELFGQRTKHVCCMIIGAMMENQEEPRNNKKKNEAYSRSI